MQNTLVFVTSNANKAREFLNIMNGCTSVQVEIKQMDIPELQGQPDDICKAKCKYAMDTLHKPVIVEDTCLCFNALDGLPGPYIKHFLKALQPQGLYRLLHGFDDKSAYATCTFALGDPTTFDIQLFKGRIDGRIVDPRGDSTFGWDPCFQPKGDTQTFAEMDMKRKNSISHRSLALKAFVKYLHSRY